MNPSYWKYYTLSLKALYNRIKGKVSLASIILFFFWVVMYSIVLYSIIIAAITSQWDDHDVWVRVKWVVMMKVVATGHLKGVKCWVAEWGVRTHPSNYNRTRGTDIIIITNSLLRWGPTLILQCCARALCPPFTIQVKIIALGFTIPNYFW